jgi:multidrug efflux system outer membrane protein
MKRAVLILPLAIVAACTVGPNYKRPPLAAPDAYRGAPGAASTASIADAAWPQVFPDPMLQTLVRAALQQNGDVQLAAARILEAQARLGVTRADQFPTVTAGVDVLGERPSVALGLPSTNLAAITAQGSIAWELDFWGKYRRATEAARAQLLASAWGQRAVVDTLISQLADAYFGLRALDLELDLSQKTLASRQESLRLTQVREQGGATSLLDVRQAEQRDAPARNRAAGEFHQLSDRQQSRTCRARSRVDR